MLCIFLLLVAQAAEPGADIITEHYWVEPKPRFHIAYELPPDLDPDLKLKVEAALEMKDFPPQPLEEDSEALFAYEAALAMSILSHNREGRYEVVVEKMKELDILLTTCKYDSLPLVHGGDLRAFLLYNLADATYYASYNLERDRIVNRPRRGDARKLYSLIVERYPASCVSAFAEIALVWYKLETCRFRESADEFKVIFRNTENKDALVLAAYGKALAHYYNRDYEQAFSWFLDEEGYKKNLKIVTDPKEADGVFTYNELADSLIDNGLLWKAQTAGRAGWWGDALDIYWHIAETYPDRHTAGAAYKKIVELYLRAAMPDSAIAATDDLKSHYAKDPKIYKEAYRYALAVLCDYTLNKAGDEEIAEEYATHLYTVVGSTEMIEEFYYTQAMELITVADIDSLKAKIERIRSYNDTSSYLVEPIYNLSLLLIKAEDYEDAINYLTELKNWPDRVVVKNMWLTSEVEFQLGRAYYELQNYEDAAAELEVWVSTYTSGDEARLDLAPNAYWLLAVACFQQGETVESPESRVGFYGKCKENLEILKDNYSGSEAFDEEFAKKVDALIAECERQIEAHR